MTPESGTLACTATGELIVDVEAERYRIAPEDVKSLIFAGWPAPVTCERVWRRDGVITGQTTIEGHAALNPAGRAVVIQTRAGCWIVPLVSFQRVACGEAASAPLFPLVLEVDVLPSLPQSTLRLHYITLPVAKDRPCYVWRLAPDVVSEAGRGKYLC
ncbi:hypothetical protein [uncultured Methanoculleus sp.]|uniref:Uncharacterized protein n=1 Tax=Methanoculleus palmolei TaxID=72612 RepID=A0ABD8AAS8_9EURY|nr:hypothetical protein R6Y95_04680 [Methanoculleus palmolei]